MPSGLFKFAVSTVFAVAASAFAHPGMPAGHPEVAHPNRTLFELITADIAVHRGDTGFAYEAWMDAAKNEKSADLAKLAWEAAVATRNPEKAIAAAKVWLDSDPAAFEARLTLLADAVERGDEAAVRAQIDELSRRSSETEKTPAEKGSWLVRLYPGLAAVKPGSGLKTAVQTLEPIVAQYPKRADVQIGFAQLLARTVRAIWPAVAPQQQAPPYLMIMSDSAKPLMFAGKRAIWAKPAQCSKNILRNIRTTAMCSSSLAALKSVSAVEPQRLMRLCAL